MKTTQNSERKWNFRRLSGYELAGNEIFLRHGNSGDWSSWSAVWVEWSAVKGMFITWESILGWHLVLPMFFFLLMSSLWFILNHGRGRSSQNFGIDCFKVERESFSVYEIVAWWLLKRVETFACGHRRFPPQRNQEAQVRWASSV